MKSNRSRKLVTKRRTVLGVLSILMVILLVAAACGEEATPTPAPATPTSAPPTPTPVPGATATPVPPTPTPLPPGVTPPPATATPVPQATATPPPTTGLRGPDDWTVENPATLAEIEAELEKFRGDSLVFVSWGGAYQAAQRQAFIVPFEDKFGIDVIEDSPPEVAKLRTMVETGNVTWHVLDWGTTTVYQLGGTGDLEELDFSIIDNRDLLAVTKTPWTAGGGITWSTVWAYSTETYPDGGPQPSTMADIYDTERFPGRRAWAYYDDPEIRFVLLSEDPSLLDTREGRESLSRLTDAQLDRSYELFDQYKDQITLFWQTGSDCPQMLISGEVDMCTAWNGRIFDAIQEGAPLKICWECGHLLSTDIWLIPKGLAEQDPDKFYLAQLFLAWTTFPEINARISLYISYGPVNLKSISVLADPEYDEVRDHLPSSATNIGFAILEDEKWGGETADARTERYVAWQQEF